MEVVEHDSFYSIVDLFPANIIAGFTKPKLDGLDVKKDMQGVLSSLGINLDIAYMNQIHTDQVHVVDGPGVYEGDAIFGSKKNIALVVKTADCLPILFYDKNTENIGAIHLSWKSAKEGLMDNIPFDCSDALIFAGPGMRQCCFEMGDFLKYSRLGLFVERGSDKKLYYDPIAFAKTEFAKKGLKGESFIDSNTCNVCDSRNFFSYRKDKTSKRILSFIIKV